VAGRPLLPSLLARITWTILSGKKSRSTTAQQATVTLRMSVEPPGVWGHAVAQLKSPLRPVVDSLLLRLKFAYFLHIHAHTLDLRRQNILWGQLRGRHLLLDHHDQGHLTRRLAVLLPHAGAHTDDVGLG